MPPVRHHRAAPPWAAVALSGIALAALLPASSAAAAATASAAQPGLAAAALAVQPGGSLTISDVPLEGLPAAATLQLERKQLVAPDARFWVQASGWPAEPSRLCLPPAAACR